MSEFRDWDVRNGSSGKDGKVVGPGAEVHVCFIKSPLEFKSWNTLRKVGADYEALAFNTALSALMVLTTELGKLDGVFAKAAGAAAQRGGGAPRF